GSPAWRAANWLGRWRVWWRTTFWPQNGEAFSTICGLLPVAVLLGALLTPATLTLVCAAVVLAWLVALWRKETSSSRDSHPWRLTVADAWAQFGIPWMIGCAAMGKSTWLGIALGICLTLSFMGLSRQPLWRFGVLAGQLAGFIIALGMRQMLVIAAISVLLIAQIGLLSAPKSGEAPVTQSLSGLHVLVLGVMLLSSLTVGFE
ncbi:MAG: hypothetical protein NZ765_13110, partial [Anaerolineae bacterium]|nr:hypothetical protein [Anaerolineae bacterium]MDW8072520.1 hypothetical protein [Anaerolineae bacterium]